MNTIGEHRKADRESGGGGGGMKLGDKAESKGRDRKGESTLSQGERIT